MTDSRIDWFLSKNYKPLFLSQIICVTFVLFSYLHLLLGFSTIYGL